MLVHFKEGIRLGKINNDTIKFYLLDGIIHSFNKLKEYDSSMAYSERMIRQAGKSENTYFEALGYYRKATVYRNLNNSEEAFRNYFLSRQRFLSVGDSIRAGKRSLEMANAQARMADYVGSQENATTALRLLSRDKDSAFISSAYNLIAISYSNRGFPKDAIREYKNAMKYSASLEDSLSYLNNIALVMRNEAEYEKALETFEEILKNADHVNENSEARFIDNYAYTRWIQDSTASVIEELT